MRVATEAMERVEILKTGVATIFQSGPFQVIKTVVRELKLSRGKYAQYDNALFVEYVEKGKRTRKIGALTSLYTIWVVEGASELQPADPFKPVASSVPGVMVSRTRFSSCDDGPVDEFRPIIEASGEKILFAEHMGR